MVAEAAAGESIQQRKGDQTIINSIDPRLLEQQLRLSRQAAQQLAESVGHLPVQDVMELACELLDGQQRSLRDEITGETVALWVKRPFGRRSLRAQTFLYDIKSDRFRLTSPRHFMQRRTQQDGQPQPNTVPEPEPMLGPNHGYCEYCGTLGPLECEIVEYLKDGTYWYSLWFCGPDCQDKFIEAGNRNNLGARH